MITRRSILVVLLFLSSWVALDIASAAGNPPDIVGPWYGTWELTEDPAWTGNCAISFWVDEEAELWAVVYAPEMGLFDEWLPAAIEEGPDGWVVTIDLTIGGITYLEIWGELDGNTLSGCFYGFFSDPPTYVDGFWQAEKYTDDPVLPGDAPGPPCNNLPPLFCTGDAASCSALLRFEPPEGVGYIDCPLFPETEENQYFSYVRRDLMLLVKYATAKVACKTFEWDYGNLAPLGLGDGSEADGATPGTSFGELRHPLGTHEGGKDIDTAYYQLYAANNLLRPVGVHYDGYFEANHLVGPPYALDVWRTALYIAYLCEHPRVRVIGVDGKVGPILEDALDALVQWKWIDSDLRDSIPLEYEEEDTGMGWYYYHHHHLHISMRVVSPIVSKVELKPETLSRLGRGKYITGYIELIEGYDVRDIDLRTVALIVDGHTILRAEQGIAEVSDYNGNGVPDLTVKFDRPAAVQALVPGKAQMAITGSANGEFFQGSDVIRVVSQ
jgi:hypothetical protein